MQHDPEGPTLHYAGRPTLCTPDVQERAVQAIRVGSTRKIACLCAGICEETWSNWMERGRKGEIPYVVFMEAIQKAEGEAASKWLEYLDIAMEQGNWQAAAWKLERRYAEDYGRAIREHTGKDGSPFEIRVIYDNEKE